MEYSFITTPYRIDRKLYKYFSNVKYAIDSIRGRHIHLDNPQDFNDPFDATVGLFHYTTMQEYDLSKLNSDVPLNNKIISSIAKVQYSPIRTDLLPATDEASQMNFIMSKSDVWSHKHEWRIVCESEQEYLPFDCISKVYLGVGFDTNAPKYQDLVRAVATHDDVDIFKCLLNQDRYQIDAEKCYDSFSMSQLKKNKELLA